MTLIVYILSKNPGKIKAAQDVFHKHGVTIKSLDVDYPEIQADTSQEIAKDAAIKAASDHNVIAIREDHSFFIHAIPGFPGPYMNYFERKIQVDQLLSLLTSANDRSAHMELAATIAYPDGTHTDFRYQVPMKIAKLAAGEKGNWDRVLMLASETTTLSETSSEARQHIWSKNYEAIALHLMQKKK